MKRTMLVVDDDKELREEIGKLFRSKFAVLYAANGKEAIIEYSAHMKDIALVLMAVQMPIFNGVQVLQVLNSKGLSGQCPIIMLSPEDDENVRQMCIKLGAMAVLVKPVPPKELEERVSEITRIFANVETLEAKLQEQKNEIEEQKARLEEFNEKLVDAISNIVEFRNMESGQHIKRVKGLTRILAKHYQAMYPEEGLTDAQIDMIVRAAAIHDIGKICVPDKILLKPGKLDNEERLVMMSHTTKGTEVLKMLAGVQNQAYYRVAYEVIRSHHERDDGGGYPDKLKGEDIPISARLVSIADVYDALVSERNYKKAYTKVQAFTMIMNGDCGAFHPHLIEAFLDAREEMEEFSDNNA